jgi:hypothetical protein
MTSEYAPCSTVTAANLIRFWNFRSISNICSQKKQISHFLKEFENIIDNEPDLGLSEEGPLMHRASPNRNHLKRNTHKLLILDSYCQML